MRVVLPFKLVGQKLVKGRDFPKSVADGSKDSIVIKVGGIPEGCIAKGYFRLSWESNTTYDLTFNGDELVVDEYIVTLPTHANNKYIDYKFSFSVAIWEGDVERLTTNPVEIVVEKSNYTDETTNTPDIPESQYDALAQSVADVVDLANSINEDVADHGRRITALEEGGGVDINMGGDNPNIYDGSDIRDKLLVSSDGTLTVYSGWKTAVIAVKPNTQYVMYRADGLAFNSGKVGALGYSADGQTLSGYANMATLPYGKNPDGTTNTKTKVFTTPDGCNYIFVTIVSTAFGYDLTETLNVQEGDTFIQELPPYAGEVIGINGKPLVDLNARERLDVVEEKLEKIKTGIDKNVVIIGDSITANAQWWVKYLLERIEFKSCTNLARSGATWRNYAETVYDITSTGGSSTADNTIWNQYNKMVARVNGGEISAPDVVAIYAGTNDVWFGSNYFGTVEDAFAADRDIIAAEANTILTSCDAIRYVVELIREAYPNCQVILATPLQGDTTKLPTAKLEQLRDLIKACGAKLGCSVINQTDESGIYSYVETKEHRFLYDGVHPNNSGDYNGAELQGKYNAKKLEQLILV